MAWDFNFSINITPLVQLNWNYELQFSLNCFNELWLFKLYLLKITQYALKKSLIDHARINCIWPVLLVIRTALSDRTQYVCVSFAWRTVLVGEFIMYASVRFWYLYFVDHISYIYTPDILMQSMGIRYKHLSLMMNNTDCRTVLCNRIYTCVLSLCIVYELTPKCHFSVTSCRH